MEKSTIKSVFNITGGNSGLTEEFIYENQPVIDDIKIPIYSGSTKSNSLGFITKKIEKNSKKLKFFKSPAILIIRKGLAGTMFHVKDDEFTINDDAYVMTVKEEWKEKINLRWFISQYQELFKNLVTSKSDNATFSKEYAEKQTIEIPDIDIQNDIAGKLIELDALKIKSNDFSNKLQKIIESSLIELIPVYHETIKSVFNITGGNSGLTEEFIYENQPNVQDEEIPILSSATIDTNQMGIISKLAKWNEDKKLKIFVAPCILVTRNGFAGQMTYLNEGEFTTNDHAYVMTVKEEWKEKINLRWFISQYQELFKNLVTSKSDNATFSKEYAEKQTIEIPDIDIQNDIAGKLIELDALKKQISEIDKNVVNIIENVSITN